MPRTPHHASATPASSAEQGEHDAFGEQLANQAPASTAERHANRDFLLPARGANEQQVRDVGARDEQDDADDAKQQPQHRPRRAGEVLLQRRNRRVRSVRGPGFQMGFS